MSTPAPDATARAFDPTKPFQERVQPWMMACFGPEIANDREERNHRFLEEALELVQTKGCTRSEAHQLVDYVFGRPVGVDVQEVGGVMVTLAALCLACHLDMHQAGEIELARIWTKVDKIRAKQAAKPKHSPLPEASRSLDLVNVEPAPDATARTFDPTKPFRTRDGRIVVHIYDGPAAGTYGGYLEGEDRRYSWGRGGVYPGNNSLDLVNVEPAPDATAFDLDELLRLAEAATSGPWVHFWNSVWSGVDFREGKWCETERSKCFGSISTQEDRALIVAARNAIPLLPAYIARREAAARRKALEEAIRVARECERQAENDHGAANTGGAEAVAIALTAVLSPTTAGALFRQDREREQSPGQVGEETKGGDATSKSSPLDRNQSNPPPQSHDQACGGDESDAAWLAETPYTVEGLLAERNHYRSMYHDAIRRASQPSAAVAAVERLQDALRSWFAVHGWDVESKDGEAWTHPDIGVDLSALAHVAASHVSMNAVAAVERERLYWLMFDYVLTLPVDQRGKWIEPMGVVKRGRFLTEAEKLKNLANELDTTPGKLAEAIRTLPSAPEPAQEPEPDISEAVRVLVAALKPFAEFIKNTDPGWDDSRRIATLNYDFDKLRLKLFRRAASALSHPAVLAAQGKEPSR